LIRAAASTQWLCAFIFDRLFFVMNNRQLLRETILEIVENQLRENNPPATKDTLDRLVNEGYTKDEARRLIGCVVTKEVFDVWKTMEPYNEERYVRALRRLPELPE
jgi:hypothetical protein